MLTYELMVTATRQSDVSVGQGAASCAKLYSLPLFSAMAFASVVVIRQSLYLESYDRYVPVALR